jgi:hypothetical protein
MLPILGDIPSDLSADDVLSDIAVPLMSTATVAAVGLGAGAGGGNGALNEAPVLGSTALVEEVLKELDKDYMALRSRLVNLLEQQSHAPLPTPSTTTSVTASESSRMLIDNHEKEDRAQTLGSLSIEGNAETASHPIINDDVTALGSSESSTASGADHLDRLEKSRTVYWPSRQLVRT